ESPWPAQGVGRLAVMRHGDEAPAVVEVEEPVAALRGLAPQDVAYTAIATELLAAIDRGGPRSPVFDEGVRVQQVMDAALESVREPAWVRVDRPEPAAGVRAGAFRSPTRPPRG